MPLTSSKQLATSLLQASGASHPSADSVAALAKRLETAVGARAWSRAAPRAWIERLGAQLAHRGTTPDMVDLGDLYLAFAAIQREPEALSELEALLEQTRSAIRHARPDAEVDEVLQRMRERLLVGTPPSGPKLAEYAGQAALLAWLRVLAARTALNAMRGAAPEQAPEEQLAQVPSAGPDPEAALVRSEQQRAFQDAFRAAVTALKPRDRAVFKMWTLDNRSLETIGAAYGVNKSTVSRWLTEIRAALLDGTTAGLRSRLKVDASQLDSVLNGLRTQLEVSLSVLREP